MRQTEKTLSRLKTNLEQISKLNMNQKLIVDQSTGYISIDTSAIQSVNRYFTGQNRQDALNKVVDNIELCILTITLLYDFLIIGHKHLQEMQDAMKIRYNNNARLYHELVDLLKSSQSGISSLVGTYSSDGAVKAQFEELGKQVTMFMTVHQDFIKKIGQVDSF